MPIRKLATTAGEDIFRCMEGLRIYGRLVNHKHFGLNSKRLRVCGRVCDCYFQVCVCSCISPQVSWLETRESNGPVPDFQEERLLELIFFVWDGRSFWFSSTLCNKAVLLGVSKSYERKRTCGSKVGTACKSSIRLFIIFSEQTS